VKNLHRLQSLEMNRKKKSAFSYGSGANTDNSVCNHVCNKHCSLIALLTETSDLPKLHTSNFRIPV